MKKIVYIPLDDRPCTYAFPVKLAEILGFKVMAPPASFLGSFTDPGDFKKIFSWLAENIKKADVLIIYLEALIFGNLLASRNKKITFKEALRRAEKLKHLLMENPKTNVFGYTVILRNAPSGLSFRGVKGAQKIVNFSAGISSFVKQREILKENWWNGLKLNCFAEKYKLKKTEIINYLKTRQRNFKLNRLFLRWLSEDVLDYLWIGSDDTAGASISRLEGQILNKEIRDLKLKNKVFQYNGTDEGSQLMFSFYAGKVFKYKPKIFPVYFPKTGRSIVTAYENKSIEKNLISQVRAGGGDKASSRSKSDIVLYINCPLDFQKEAVSQDENKVVIRNYYKNMAFRINKDIAAKRVVSLADVAYANGADIGLVKYLEKNTDISKFASFSAWNTAGNSIGTAVSGSIIFYLSKKPPLIYSSSAGGKEENLKLLIERFLDDYIYQSLVKKKINEKIKFLGLSPYNLGKNKTRIERFLKKEMKRESSKFLKNNFKREKLKFKFSFPWPRTFEVKIVNRLLEG